MNYSINNTKNYYNNLAKDYNQLYLDEISKAENAIVENLLVKRILDLKKSDVKILDLGCGTGLIYELLNRNKLLIDINIQYHGIDISDKMINIANDIFIDNDPCSFVTGDMKDIKLHFNEKYDLICSSFGSFSHSFEFKCVLNSAYDLLNPNGKLFLMVYSRYSMRAFFNYFFLGKKNAFNFCQSYDVRNNNSIESCDALFYTNYEIKDILTHSGFDKINVCGLNVFCEIPMLKGVLKNISMKRAMVIDSIVAKFFPNLGHSLIVDGVKK